MVLGASDATREVTGILLERLDAVEEGKLNLRPVLTVEVRIRADTKELTGRYPKYSLVDDSELRLVLPAAVPF